MTTTLSNRKESIFFDLTEYEVLSCKSAAELICESKPQNIGKAYELYECLAFNCGINCDKEGIAVIFDDYAKGYNLFEDYYQ